MLLVSARQVFSHPIQRGVLLLTATVRRIPVKGRADRDHPVRVDGFMTAVVVVTNVRQVYCVGDTRHLVNVAQETAQVQIVADTVAIAFKWVT